MAEVDIASGLPKEESEKSTSTQKYNHLTALKGRSDQLQESLASEKGQMVLHFIKEQLLNRVNKLMSEDGQCVALKKLLVDMGLTINVGEMAVENLMRLVMKKQAQ